MDPDQTLKELREAIEQEDAWAALDCIQNLDDWIMKGGFLPKEWHEAQKSQA